MFKKFLIGFFVFFLLIVSLVIAYKLYNRSLDKASSEVRDESIKVIDIIKKATDEIGGGAPVRSKRGVISSDDYDFILNYCKKYEELLSDGYIPEEHGHTKSEQKLVEYTITLFVDYGLMNEQFIYGDVKFAASIMDSLYEKLDKAPAYLYLESKNELTDIGTEKIETKGTESPQGYEPNKNRTQETNSREQSDKTIIESSPSDLNKHNNTIHNDNEEQKNEPQNNNDDEFSKERRDELSKEVKQVLGEDFVFDPNKEYDTKNWTDEMIEALMTAESLYYKESGEQSPYD